MVCLGYAPLFEVNRSILRSIGLCRCRSVLVEGGVLLSGGLEEKWKIGSAETQSQHPKSMSLPVCLLTYNCTNKAEICTWLCIISVLFILRKTNSWTGKKNVSRKKKRGGVIKSKLYTKSTSLFVGRHAKMINLWPRDIFFYLGPTGSR